MGAGCHAVRLPGWKDARVVSIWVVAALLSKAQANEKTTAARWAGRGRQGDAVACNNPDKCRRNDKGPETGPRLAPGGHDLAGVAAGV